MGLEEPAVMAENRCRLLIRKDVQNDFTWRGVTVVSPFLDRKTKRLRMVMEE
jgi:predicted nucleic acid-binding protein